MDRASATGRHIRWADGDVVAPRGPAVGRPGGVRRVGSRMAWDHSVLEDDQGRLEWTRRDRVEARHPASVRPIWIMLVAWVMAAWGALAVWGVWTRHDVDAHLAMRFLARGDVEELGGVVLGLVWYVLPAGIAFWLARHVRIVSRDERGVRSYWIALVMGGLAALGVFRPLWDSGAGSRFATWGSSPASASAAPAPAALPDESPAEAEDTANADGPSASAAPESVDEFLFGPWPMDRAPTSQTASADPTDG